MQWWPDHLNMQLCTCSCLKELCFNIWNKFQNYIFPPWHWNHIASSFFPSCGPVCPRQGLLGYPLLGLLFPRRGTCHTREFGLPSGPPWLWCYFYPFFHHYHPNPSFSIAYLNSPSNMWNHPHFSKHLAWINNLISHDLFKNMFKTILKSHACMEWM